MTLTPSLLNIFENRIDEVFFKWLDIFIRVF